MSDFPAADYFSDPDRNNAEAKAAQDAWLAATKQLLGAAAESALTIATGVVTPTGGGATIDTESAAASDDLANIATTNLPAGSLLLIRAASAARVVTVKHNAGGAGQIALFGAADAVLDATSKFLLLRRTGTTWEEVARFGFTSTFTGGSLTTAINEAKGASVATASTCDIWTPADGNLIHLTGTTTVASFGTAPQAGANRRCIADGDFQITHHATTLKCVGGENMSIKAGDRFTVLADTTANMVVTDHVRAAAVNLETGRQTIYIPAAAITPRTTNGAAAGSTETTTNKVMLAGLDFDASTIEYGQFAARMPKSWNEGTVAAVFTWRHGSTTTNFKVSWGLQAVALSNDDAADAAFGTAQYANDEGGTTNDIYVSPETSAITIAGTPAAEDWVVFQVLRKADDGTNDTLAIDATLLGVTLYVTLNAPTDA